LGGNDASQDFESVGHDCGGRFVASCLNTQNFHGVIFSIVETFFGFVSLILRGRYGTCLEIGVFVWDRLLFT
jgi:hypothetical protein